MGYDRFHMLLGRISHVPFPAVLRVFLRKFPHVFVPVCLGEYRGCGYGREFAVSLYHTLVFIPVERLELVAIDEQEFRFYTQSAHRPLHSGDGCIQYIYSIDFFCAHFLNSPCYCLALDDRTKHFPGLFGHFLRVVQKRVVEVWRQDYRCSEYRTCKRAATCFVTACLYASFL